MQILLTVLWFAIYAASSDVKMSQTKDFIEAKNQNYLDEELINLLNKYIDKEISYKTAFVLQDLITNNQMYNAQIDLFYIKNSTDTKNDNLIIRLNILCSKSLSLNKIEYKNIDSAKILCYKNFEDVLNYKKENSDNHSKKFDFFIVNSKQTDILKKLDKILNIHFNEKPIIIDSYDKNRNELLLNSISILNKTVVELCNKDYDKKNIMVRKCIRRQISILKVLHPKQLLSFYTYIKYRNQLMLLGIKNEKDKNLLAKILLQLENFIISRLKKFEICMKNIIKKTNFDINEEYKPYCDAWIPIYEERANRYKRIYNSILRLFQNIPVVNNPVSVFEEFDVQKKKIEGYEKCLEEGREIYEKFDWCIKTAKDALIANNLLDLKKNKDEKIKNDLKIAENKNLMIKNPIKLLALKPHTDLILARIHLYDKMKEKMTWVHQPDTISMLNFIQQGRFYMEQIKIVNELYIHWISKFKKILLESKYAKENNCEKQSSNIYKKIDDYCSLILDCQKFLVGIETALNNNEIWYDDESKIDILLTNHFKFIGKIGDITETTDRINSEEPKKKLEYDSYIYLYYEKFDKNELNEYTECESLSDDFKQCLYIYMTFIMISISDKDLIQKLVTWNDENDKKNGWEKVFSVMNELKMMMYIKGLKKYEENNIKNTENIKTESYSEIMYNLILNLPQNNKDKKAFFSFMKINFETYNREEVCKLISEVLEGKNFSIPYVYQNTLVIKMADAFKHCDLQFIWDKVVRKMIRVVY